MDSEVAGESSVQKLGEALEPEHGHFSIESFERGGCAACVKEEKSARKEMEGKHPFVEARGRHVMHVSRS